MKTSHLILLTLCAYRSPFSLWRSALLFAVG